MIKVFWSESTLFAAVDFPVLRFSRMSATFCPGAIAKNQITLTIWLLV
ncbi:MAG: hypothetical protein IPG90_19495 [Bacteroidetes bacterium]|nr:hypothetical protein [Bacteroidota bacterium]MBL0259342.1 hypothetical protein [Bacteroidota bacterium]MBP6403288.1 hypothetical protein [Bacteroidia bacterium]MBP6649347.1 hypothetical protein [Bacteroidia bacterium]